MTCPTCARIEHDLDVARAEAREPSHAQDRGLLVQYVRAILRALLQHERTHAGDC